MKKRYMVEIEFEKTEVYTDTLKLAIQVAGYLIGIIKQSSKETVRFHLEHESEVLVNWLNDAGEWQTMRTYRIFED